MSICRGCTRPLLTKPRPRMAPAPSRPSIMGWWPAAWPPAPSDSRTCSIKAVDRGGGMGPAGLCPHFHGQDTNWRRKPSILDQMGGLQGHALPAHAADSRRATSLTGTFAPAGVELRPRASVEPPFHALVLGDAESESDPPLPRNPAPGGKHATSSAVAKTAKLTTRPHSRAPDRPRPSPGDGARRSPRPAPGARCHARCAGGSCGSSAA
jgi:hypothetical protein